MEGKGLVDAIERYVIKYGVYAVTFTTLCILIPSVIVTHAFIYWGLDREPYPDWYYIDAGLTFGAALPILLLILGLADKMHKQKLELYSALSKVKELESILPMCADCKDIRDADGCWHAPDIYIREYTNTHVSHGLCNTCAAKALVI